MCAARIAPASREQVLLPPKGWRKAIPIAVKLQVVVNQHGRAPDGTLLDAMGVGIQFDHRPPLHEREYDPAADDTIPAANSVEHIVALPVPAHRKVSACDVSRMAKTSRIRSTEGRFSEILSRKVCGQKREPKGTLRSRGFDKSKKRRFGS